jgi:hypothetical protein
MFYKGQPTGITEITVHRPNKAQQKPTSKNKFISIMPCSTHSASDLMFLFSYINITKLYFTGMKIYQASFKPQMDPTASPF